MVLFSIKSVTELRTKNSEVRESDDMYLIAPLEYCTLIVTSLIQFSKHIRLCSRNSRYKFGGKY